MKNNKIILIRIVCVYTQSSYNICNDKSCTIYKNHNTFYNPCIFRLRNIISFIFFILSISFSSRSFSLKLFCLQFFCSLSLIYVSQSIHSFVFVCLICLLILLPSFLFMKIDFHSMYLRF